MALRPRASVSRRRQEVVDSSIFEFCAALVSTRYLFRAASEHFLNAEVVDCTPHQM